MIPDIMIDIKRNLNEVTGGFSWPMQDRRELEGLFYSCKFDHTLKSGFLEQEHYHEIIDAKLVTAPHYIFNGLALLLIDKVDGEKITASWHSGCPYQFIYDSYGIQKGKEIIGLKKTK